MDPGIQEFTDYRKVRRGAGMDENRVAGFRQIHQGVNVGYAPGLTDTQRFFLRRRKRALQRPVSGTAQYGQPGFLCNATQTDNADT